MRRYSIEPRTRKCFKGYGFLSIAKKYKKQLLDTVLNASKKVVYKAGEYLGNKIADAVLSKTLATRTKSSDDNIEKQTLVEDIIIPPKKEKKILKKLRKEL